MCVHLFSFVICLFATLNTDHCCLSLLIFGFYLFLSTGLGCTDQDKRQLSLDKGWSFGEQSNLRRPHGVLSRHPHVSELPLPGPLILEEFGRASFTSSSCTFNPFWDGCWRTKEAHLWNRRTSELFRVLFRVCPPSTLAFFVSIMVMRLMNVCKFRLESWNEYLASDLNTCTVEMAWWIHEQIDVTAGWR